MLQPNPEGSKRIFEQEGVKVTLAQRPPLAPEVRTERRQLAAGALRAGGVESTELLWLTLHGSPHEAMQYLDERIEDGDATMSLVRSAFRRQFEARF